MPKPRLLHAEVHMKDAGSSIKCFLRGRSHLLGGHRNGMLGGVGEHTGQCTGNNSLLAHVSASSMITRT